MLKDILPLCDVRCTSMHCHCLPSFPRPFSNNCCPLNPLCWMWHNILAYLPRRKLTTFCLLSPQTQCPSPPLRPHLQLPHLHNLPLPQQQQQQLRHLTGKGHPHAQQRHREPHPLLHLWCVCVFLCTCLCSKSCLQRGACGDARYSVHNLLRCVRWAMLFGHPLANTLYMYCARNHTQDPYYITNIFFC